jgi:peptide/nickel transport system substrate-binding protein
MERESHEEAMMKRGIILIALCLGLLLNLQAAQGAPRDAVVIAQGTDATTMDPHMRWDTPAINILMNIYDFLLTRSPDLTIQPLLASSYRIVNDTTWELNLRQGVKFHNGEEFNAAAVKFSLERLADPKNKLQQTALQIIERVDIINEFRVHVITKKPFPYLDAQLTNVGAAIPPKYFQEKGVSHFSLYPVGTGPYKLVRWAKDDQLEMEANPNYWRGVPRIKRAIFRPIPEDTSRVAGLQTQELDTIVNIPPNLANLMNWKGRSTVAKIPSARTVFLVLENTTGGPTADVRVRRAIAQAIDQDKIIKNILEGNAVKLASPLSKYQFGYDPSIKPYDYNPAEAKKLLAEAGYPNGFDLPINSPSGRYLKDKEVVEAIMGDLRKVGINATIRVLEWGSYMTQLYARKLGPAYLLGWGGLTFDADGTFFPLFRTGQALSNFSSPKLDALLEQARSTMDRQKRQKLYAEASRVIKDEVPCAFVYQQVDIYGVSERLNWKPRPDERLFVFDMDFRK